MKVLDLFSGIGGFSLGLERAGMETVAFCEIEEYPKKVLDKNWRGVPIASDVTKLTYKDGGLYDNGKEIYTGSIDVICGGFPCQDLSVAGNQKGIEADRSGLWSECSRLLSEVRPDYAIFENVTALLNGGGGKWFERVLRDISEVGYDAEWHCIPASELGANHHRDRIWIIAYPNSQRLQKNSGIRQIRDERNSVFRDLLREKVRVWDKPAPAGTSFCGVRDGLPNRPHRLKCLGNAVVPQIPEIIGRAIMKAVK